MEAAKPKPAAAPALDSHHAQLKGGPQSVGIVVSLIAQLRRLMDSDNLVGSLKPLRDAIAASLGVDDGDASIGWDYGQYVTTGDEGVIVKIDIKYGERFARNTKVSDE